MSTIEKKVWPEYFAKVLAGDKKFELRLNDFEVGEGDTLVLKEWDPDTKDYTGRSLEKKVSYVLKFKLGESEKFWSKDEIADKGLQIISLD